MERAQFESLFQVVEHMQAVEQRFFLPGEKEKLYRFMCGDMKRQQLWADVERFISHAPYLHNYFQIGTDAFEQLERCERLATSARLLEALIDPTKVAGDFSLGHFQAIHRYLFQDVFPWAGQWRTVDIAKDSHVFAHFRQIELMASCIFTQLHELRCLRGLPAEDFSEQLAILLGDLNALQPFYEGNGRSTCLFAELLAAHAGWSFRFSDIEPHLLYEAMEASTNDESLLIEHIYRIVGTPIH